MRHTLSASNICAKATAPHLLITAGVHGDEYEPMLAVRRLVGEFQQRLTRGSVTLVPVVNENALARGQRVAEDELDLAEVFDDSQSVESGDEALDDDSTVDDSDSADGSDVAESAKRAEEQVEEDTK
jgi:predicted deacylase